MRSGRALLVGMAIVVVSCAPKAKPAAGAAPSSVEFRDLEAKPRRLDEFKGRVVLLDFWATWCAPCVQSLPLYETWQKEFGPKGFTVIAVSVDKEAAAAKSFLAERAPSLTAFHDPEFKAVSAINAPKMPTAFLIGRDGAVVLREEGFDRKKAAALEAKIRELLQ